MITGPARCGCALETQRRQVELVDKHIHDPNRGIFRNVILDTLRQKKLLTTSTTFDETAHPTPPNDVNNPVTSRRFHTASVESGAPPDVRCNRVPRSS